LPLKVSALLIASCIVLFQVNAAPFLPSVDEDISLEGPNNLWVKTYNYTNTIEHICVSRTESGYVISGTFENSSSFDFSNGIIFHVATNGSVLFQKTLGGGNEDEIYSAIQCENGDFVITGDTLSFGANETGGPKLWVSRLANNGSVLWNKWYDDIHWGGNSLAECQDGSFIIATTDPQLVRIHANGSFIWSKSYEDWDISDANSVVVCDDGGFAFAGLADTDPTSEIGYQAWLVRTDSNGTMLWNQTYGNAPLNIGRSLIQCSDGGFVIAGESGAWMYFPRSPWLVRTDANGALLWNKTYSTGYAHSVVECSDGGFGIAGVAAESGAYSTWDALFVRTDEEGNELWRSICSGPNQNQAHSLVLSEDGGFAVAGWTWQETSIMAFLWRLSDDYVTPAPTTTTDGLSIPIEVVCAISLGTGIVVVAVVVWKGNNSAKEIV
jgi:hypothetical protein